MMGRASSTRSNGLVRPERYIAPLTRFWQGRPPCRECRSGSRFTLETALFSRDDGCRANRQHIENI